MEAVTLHGSLIAILKSGFQKHISRFVKQTQLTVSMIDIYHLWYQDLVSRMLLLSCEQETKVKKGRYVVDVFRCYNGYPKCNLCFLGLSPG